MAKKTVSNVRIFDYISSVFGVEAAEKYANLDFTGASRAQIRVNTLRTTSDELIKNLKEKYGIITTPFEGFENILKVLEDPKGVLGKTTNHLLGEYYIQSLSSMLPPIILAPEKDDIVLDLCAAPGSKSTQLAALMENSGTLVLNEASPQRAGILVYNMERMGAMNAGVIREKGEWLGKYFQNHFDKILVDAPCSGLGILMKKGEVNNWWSESAANQLAELQYRLLVSAVKMLRPGGILVYSTCTLTLEENEYNVDKILNKYPMEIIPFELPLELTDGYTGFGDIKLDRSLSLSKRVLPWQFSSEGFFMVKMKKQGETEPLDLNPQPKSKLKHISAKKIEAQLATIEERFGLTVKLADMFNFLTTDETIYFTNKEFNVDLPAAFDRIGQKFGVIDRSGEITMSTHGLRALGDLITKSIIDLTEDVDFKSFMEGGTIKRITQPLGQVAIRYEGKIIGAAIVSEHGAKSRFPRNHRTNEIILH